MDLDERIGRVVERTRATWGVCTAAVGIWVLMTFPLWAIVPFFIFSVGTYFASLWMVGIALGYMISDEEYAAHRAAQEATIEVVDGALSRENIESIGLEVGEIIETSEPIGVYLDQPIFDWVDIKDTSGKARYVFEHVTQRDRAGNLVLPREEGFACFNGVTYRKVQPA